MNGTPLRYPTTASCTTIPPRPARLIRAVENFITSSLQDLFPGGEIGNEDVLTQALNLVHQWHAPRAVPASELLRAIETKTRFLPFGCATIDALLDGGLREGHVTELCGDSGAPLIFESGPAGMPHWLYCLHGPISVTALANRAVYEP